MSLPAISVRQLGKRYRLQNEGRVADYQMLSESLGRLLSVPYRWIQQRRVRRSAWFWALEDVTFEVAPGEVVGVIGRNGAGKSTLLKILSRVTKPSCGEADLRGRVGSLLEVGTGFHPELTGRENIYLNGGILGMSRRDIRRRFEPIVEFSGVERFLDTPVKRYSSGMRVRLAFAVAAHLEPEILVVDEVLAVGDLAFQQKCLARMGEVASGGRTVLFVSHNMPAVESLCTRAMLLDGGRLVCSGPTDEIVDHYIRSMSSVRTGTALADISLEEHPNRRPSSRTLLTRLHLRDSAGQPTAEVPVGGGLAFELEYRNPQRTSGLGFAVFLCSESGQRLAMLHSRVHSRVVSNDATRGSVRCEVAEIPLLPGTYRLDVAAGTWDELLDYVEHAASLTVVPADYLGSGELPNNKQGLLALPCRWTLRSDIAQRSIRAAAG